MTAIAYMSLIVGAISLVCCRGHAVMALAVVIFMVTFAIQDGGFHRKNNEHLQTPH